MARQGKGQSKAEEIFSTVVEIWRLYLKQEITRTSDMSAAGSEEATLSACIQISGAWQGVVTLVCRQTLARQISAALLETSPEGVSSEDMRDALGELGLIVGGHLLKLVPQPSHLSVPLVVEGDRFTLRLFSNRAETKVVFACGDEPLDVLVVEELAEA